MLPFNVIDDNEIYLLNNTQVNIDLDITINDDVNVIPNTELKEFIKECKLLNFDLDSSDKDKELFPCQINSNYYDISDLNKLKLNSSSTLSMMHTNIASLNKHCEDFKLILSLLNKQFDVIGITEHKILKDIIPTNKIDIEGYHKFIYGPIETTHGGAGFYIKEDLLYNERPDLNFDLKGNFDTYFIEITNPRKKNLIIGCIYRHPTSTITVEEFNLKYIDPVLVKISRENKFCSIMGDFNINLLNCEIEKDCMSFFNIMQSNYLAPYVLQPTRPSSKTLIDNIFFNSLEFNSYSGNLTIDISDHLIQFVIFENFHKHIMKDKVNIYKRNFKNFNEDEFGKSLNGADWDYILKSDNQVDELWNNFHNQVNFLLDEFAPMKKVTPKETKLTTKPWISKELLKTMLKKNKLYKLYCSEKVHTKKESLFNKYKLIRNEVTKLKRESKTEYYKKYFEENRNKSSMVWKGIRSLVNLKNSNTSSYKIADNTGKHVSDQYKIANLFNDYFVKIGSSVEQKIPNTDKDFNEYLTNLKIDKTFFLSPTDKNEIMDIIKLFDINKSLGPNSIPIYILKVYKEFFSEKLFQLINISFEAGIFPDLCKLAKVIPIHKKDDKSSIFNYRPISLLPLFSKIFEKIIYKRLYTYFNDNKLIYHQQFGFRANHSTNHALISLTEQIKSKLDTGHYVGGIFIDLEKAFDTVNHTMLCRKLEYYGIRGIPNLLIKSFLSNRKQYVSINGFESNIKEISCGVPQGSTLGPLLFLIYINDFQYSLDKSKASHFADDTNILYASKSIKTIETVLNHELKLASTWLCANKLSLNEDKTKLIIFHSRNKVLNENSISIKLNNKKLSLSKSVNYLGLSIDDCLSWNNHISNLSRKLSRANGILSKLRYNAPKNVCISVYYSIFYSHINYGNSVWTLTSEENLNSIRILQKKCLRIINFSEFNAHTNELFSIDKLLKLDDVIEFNHLKIIFEYKNNLLPDTLNSLFLKSTDVHSYMTRNAKSSGLFIPTIQSVKHGNKSLRYMCPVSWNSFSRNNTFINQAKTLNQLKVKLKSHYVKSYI